MPHFWHGSLPELQTLPFRLWPPFPLQMWYILNLGTFTRETRLLIIKKGLNSTEFAGRSFRIGVATAGLPPWLIKVLGRWSSDCFERYKKIRPSVLEQVPNSWLACYDFTKCNAFFVGFTPFACTINSKNQFYFEM